MENHESYNYNINIQSEISTWPNTKYRDINNITTI